MAGRGEACYFPRDLTKGSYGGDVNCFQQYLSHKGYLLDEPTGYFGERTATATRRWQRDNGISGDDAGDFGECAVLVYFPKFDPDFEGQQEILLIKSRVSTLAISGRTPDEASALQQANGDSAEAVAGGQAGGADGR